VSHTPHDAVTNAFSLDDATRAVSQAKVKDHEGERNASSMLADIIPNKNRGDQIKMKKLDSDCHGCGKKGHWYKDRTECLSKVIKKRRRARQEREEKYGKLKLDSGTTSDSDQDEKKEDNGIISNKKKSGSLFQRGGM